MKIGDIDPNFKVESSLGIPDLIWLNAKDEPFTIHGLMPPEHGKPFRRMPDDIAASVSPGVRHLAANTAGGRIRFRTDAGVIALKAVMPDVEIMAHITATGNVISEEKMAIVLQEICGSEDGGYYFPTISGVK